MGLSNAERQRKWRRRQKEENAEEYRRKENERKRRAYKPHHLLSKTDLQEQRSRDRLKAKRKYHRQKQKKGNNEPSTSRMTRLSARDQLIVNMTFKSKGNAARKRYKTALRKAYREIKLLATQNAELKTSVQKERKRAQKQRQRILQKAEKTKINSLPTENGNNMILPITPRSKTKLMVRKAGLQINSKNAVYKQLLFGNTLTESLKSSLKKYKTKQSKTKLLALDVIRKYRCLNVFSRQIGIERKKARVMNNQRKGTTMKQKYGTKVEEFLEREDNSTLQPGKKDTKTVEKTIHQKRVLNDYLHSIYEKFITENPESKISKTQFCRLRPRHILLTCFSSRKTCLCKYHQNFALKLKAMRSEGVKCSASPDVFLKEFSDDKALEEVLRTTMDPDKETKYKKWKRVQTGDKYRWKEMEEIVDKDTFIFTIMDELAAIRKHVERIQNQYAEMRRLRQNLPKDEIMVWMDFAENFSCTSQEEVQSAYWTTDMISLHTMVVYSESEVQSYVAISDVLTHNASVVYCIIQKFVPLLKEKYPDLKKIHYLTDSPTSQYGNKTVFEILCHHNSDFGVSARWNYLEVGHGKGPCNGLGGSVKRCADLAVRQRKCSIQDASQFFNWATSNNVSKVKYILYTAEDVEHAEAIIGEKPTAFTIQGTMKVHAVVHIDKFTVAIRELSCYCCECMANVTTTHCSGWSLKQIIKKPVEEEPARSTESESAQNN